MTLVELGVSRQANAFYRTANGARHERNWPAAHQYVRKQQLCRVIRAQVESKYQSDLSDKSVKSGSTPAYQRSNATQYGASQGSVQQTTEARRRHAATAVFAALRLTHAFRIITHVASHLALDIRRGLFRKAQQTQQGLSQAQQTIQQVVEQPAQTISQAESELKAAWLRLQQHAVAGGDALMKMLHSLDKPSITLDAKWADMQEQLAGNKDVSERLQTLFASSVESTKTVATMLAQSGGSIQQSYWTSPQTQKVIEQEEELRSVVFAQMLGATS